MQHIHYTTLHNIQLIPIVLIFNIKLIVKDIQFSSFKSFNNWTTFIKVIKKNSFNQIRITITKERKYTKMKILSKLITNRYARFQ